MRLPRLSASLRMLAGHVLLLGLCALPAAAQSATAPPAPPAATAQAAETAQPAANAGAELAQRLDAILARADVARGFWGIEVETLDSGLSLYSRNADRLFAPASNAKLFTTAAALALIGSGYRTQTTVEAAAPPDRYGRIGGDLVLVGRGDPNLSGRELPFHTRTERPLPPTHVIEELADQLVAHGVKVIDGDIEGDDSFFAYEPYGQGWSQEDVVSLWGAPVSALAVNDDVVFVNVLPAARAGERAFLSLSPFAEGYYQIDNRVLTTPAGNGPRRIFIEHRPGTHDLELRGSIPLGDPNYGEAVAVDDPAQWAAWLLRDALARRGVVVYGGVRAHHLPQSWDSASSGPPGAASASPAAIHAAQPVAPRIVLAEHGSLPLGLDITVTDKVSQNLHAEMLLRLLGRERGSGGSVAAGLQVLGGFLTLAGIAPEEYALYDGCGLSRHDLVSPRAIVRLLRYAAAQSWGAEFLNSLPLAGVDGTLASRLQNLPPAAAVSAKTGSLAHVNVLSGYLTSAGGRRLAFSILSNNSTLRSEEADAVIDEIVTEIQRSAN